MEIRVRQVTSWERVLDATRMTVGKGSLGKEPSNKFKRQMLIAEHSPIRLLEFDITIKDVPYFVVMHLVRHNQGIEKFVCTSREDRTGVPRDQRKQTDLVSCQFSCNAQALINISRKRLCGRADKETRKVWMAVQQEIAKVDHNVAYVMRPECIYSGFCREKDTDCCGYCHTKLFEENLKNYRESKNLL